MKIVQILHNKAHYIFEADSIPDLPPYPDGTLPVLKDITDHTAIQEGWNYDEATGEFSEPELLEVGPITPAPAPTPQDPSVTILAAIAELYELIETKGGE